MSTSNILECFFSSRVLFPRHLLLSTLFKTTDNFSRHSRSNCRTILLNCTKESKNQQEWRIYRHTRGQKKVISLNKDLPPLFKLGQLYKRDYISRPIIDFVRGSIWVLKKYISLVSNSAEMVGIDAKWH